MNILTSFLPKMSHQIVFLFCFNDVIMYSTINDDVNDDFNHFSNIKGTIFLPFIFFWLNNLTFWSNQEKLFDFLNQNNLDVCLMPDINQHLVYQITTPRFNLVQNQS